MSLFLFCFIVIDINLLAQRTLLLLTFFVLLGVGLFYCIVFCIFVLHLSLTDYIL